MNLNKLYLTSNNCYKEGKTIKVKGIMVHSTGANNPNLRRYVGPDDGKLGVNLNHNHWNTAKPNGRLVCVHAFIGKLADGSIATYQTLPWSMRGWHAGGSANDTHIGFEICEDYLQDASYFSKVYKESIELCAHLCIEYNLDPLKDGVIICHSEGYKRGIASNHSDIMHWFPKHGKDMDTFRKDVNDLKITLTRPSEFRVGDIVEFSGSKQYVTSNSSVGVKAQSTNAQITKIVKGSKHPYHLIAIDNQDSKIIGVHGWVNLNDISRLKDDAYLVRIIADTLNIRKGPSTDFKVVGKTKRNQYYTIIRIQDNWGLLKSKIGWICLSYTERID